MKTVVSLELSDAQRNALAQTIDGKNVKRLATREEVREYVEGCVGALSVEPPPRGKSTGATTAAEGEEAARLRAEGKSEGYIRGWLNVGRK